MSPTFFPFFSAALYAMGYLMIERFTTGISVLTFMVLSCISGLFAVLLLWWVKAEPLTLAPLMEKPVLALGVAATLIVTLAGWIFSVYAIREISALYAAMGEISYPLFIPIFAALFFGGTRHFDITTIIGGLLVFLGSVILIYGRMKMDVGE